MTSLQKAQRIYDNANDVYQGRVWTWAATVKLLGQGSWGYTMRDALKRVIEGCNNYKVSLNDFGSMREVQQYFDEKLYESKLRLDEAAEQLEQIKQS